MKTIKAFIERGNDGSFSVYVDHADNTLNYGIHGTGDTVKEAVDDFMSAYDGMKEFHAGIGKKFVEANFDFVYDTASFLQYYSNYFSLAGLSRLTGINQRQLSHYVNGTRNPGKRTVAKIDTAIRNFANDLSQVQFV